MPTQYAPGELVEVRRLPGQKDWNERATYIRRITKEEMPSWWRGPLGHVVKLRDGRTTELSSQRVRKVAARATEIAAKIKAT